MKKIIIFLALIFSVSFKSCGVVEKLANKNPMIKSISATPAQISTQDTTILVVRAEDPDGDLLSFKWDCDNNGTLLSFTEEEVKWIAPNYSGKFRIEVKVTDENGGKVTGEIYVEVKGDEVPVVTITEPSENQVFTGIGYVPISVSVSYQWPISRVEFYLGKDSLLFSDSAMPYQYNGWNVAALSGQKLLKARAYDKSNEANFGEDSVHVYIEGVVPIPK